jgi:hypothetical protein
MARDLSAEQKKGRKRRTTIIIALLCAFPLFVCACFLAPLFVFLVSSTGFQIVNGKPAYVTWDEGNGRRVHDLPGADRETFSILSRHGYAKDSQSVYFHTKKMEHAHAASFVELPSKYYNYAKDDRHVFLNGVVIPDCDSASFQLREFPYAVDVSHAFCGTVKIPIRSVEQFVVIKGFTGISGFTDGPRQDQKGEPFILGDGWSKDDESIFLGIEKIDGIDRDSFIVLNEGYAKDKHNVYHDGHILADADAASFTAEDFVFARDKNRKYISGKPK